MSDTLQRLKAQTTRTVTLLAVGAHAERAAPGTPDSITFTVARVDADRLRSNLLFAALGKDGYVAYAQWYNQQAQADLEKAKINSAKEGDPPPFDDALPDDADWRAHTIALEAAAEDAILELGLLDPSYADARAFLGPYRSALVREIVQWDREVPADPKSLSGSSEPP